MNIISIPSEPMHSYIENNNYLYQNSSHQKKKTIERFIVFAPLLLLM